MSRLLDMYTINMYMISMRITEICALLVTVAPLPQISGCLDFPDCMVTVQLEYLVKSVLL